MDSFYADKRRFLCLFRWKESIILIYSSFLIYTDLASTDAYLIFQLSIYFGQIIPVQIIFLNQKIFWFQVKSSSIFHFQFLIPPRKIHRMNFFIFRTFLSVRKVPKEACSAKELLKKLLHLAKINKLGLPADFIL